MEKWVLWGRWALSFYSLAPLPVLQMPPATMPSSPRWAVFLQTVSYDPNPTTFLLGLVMGTRKVTTQCSQRDHRGFLLFPPSRHNDKQLSSDWRKALTRAQLCWYLDLGLVASTPRAYGTLSQHPKQLRKGLYSDSTIHKKTNGVQENTLQTTTREVHMAGSIPSLALPI